MPARTEGFHNSTIGCVLLNREGIRYDRTDLCLTVDDPKNGRSPSLAGARSPSYGILVFASSRRHENGPADNAHLRALSYGDGDAQLSGADLDRVECSCRASRPRASVKLGRKSRFDCRPDSSIQIIRSVL